jgi:hypothetical protein
MFSKQSKTTAACFALILFLSACAQQSKPEKTSGETTTSVTSVESLKPVRISAENTDAAEPSVAVGMDGAAYVVWVEHRNKKEADVLLARVEGEGQMKGAPVRVNPKAGEATAWRGDPPTVAVSSDGAIYVGWTARVDAPIHANDLYLSVSRDGGRSFEPPVKVNDDRKQVAHAMHSLAIGADNRIHVVWLDERNVVFPPPGQDGKKMEHMEANRDVFTSYSADGGRSFSPNRKIAEDACPCCKTAITAGRDGQVFASWRQVLPGDYRHIALAASADGGQSFSQPVIVSDDRWMISGCPVSGPALSLADDNRLRVVWYTAGERGAPGLYWAESSDAGKTFSESRSFRAGPMNGNPFLLDNKRGAIVVWERNDGGLSRVISEPLGAGNSTAESPPLVQSAELPSAATAGDQMFVTYIARINERRSVWIVKMKLNA